MIEGGVRRAAEEFWQAAGGAEPFPRTVERAVYFALPLAVTRISRLWVQDVEDWLRRRDVPFRLCAPNRPLHGCLIAFRGQGWVLMDGTDHDDEDRFTLAHEAAHFMLDYLAPRRRAAGRLGTDILDVFDGLRPAGVGERIDAVLGETPVGVHTHLMERQPDGVFACGRVAGAESRADLLALELLAPSVELHRRLAGLGRPAGFAQAAALVSGLLRDGFGLPPAVVSRYAGPIARTWHGGPSFREWLGLGEGGR